MTNKKIKYDPKLFIDCIEVITSEINFEKIFESIRMHSKKSISLIFESNGIFLKNNVSGGTDNLNSHKYPESGNAQS